MSKPSSEPPQDNPGGQDSRLDRSPRQRQGGPAAAGHYPDEARELNEGQPRAQGNAAEAGRRGTGEGFKDKA